MHLQLSLLLLALIWSLNTAAAPGGNGVVPKEVWYDSYSVDGKCYIDSGLGKGMGDVIVPTPVGGQTLEQVAKRLGPGPGSQGNPIYNDVQCGHGPASTARNEAYDQCPGRVDQGAAGCAIIGPKWDLEGAYSSNSSTSDVPVIVNSVAAGGDCQAIGYTLNQSRAKYAKDCSSYQRVDCDRIVLDGEQVWMCASHEIGNGSPLKQMQPAAASQTEQSVPTANASTSQQITDIDVIGTTETVSTPAELTAGVVVKQEGQCEALGDDLVNAKNAYANKCAAKRVDCDPTGNGKEYLCASYRISKGAPAIAETVAAAVTVVDLSLSATEPAPVASEPEPVLAEANSERCSATGSSLQLAKTAYAESCNLKRVDCDPTGNGGYICASYAMGAAATATPSVAEVVVASSASESTGGESTLRIEAESLKGSGWVNRGSYIEFTGSNSYQSPTHGTLTYQVEIPSSGQWEMRWRAKAAKKTSGRNDLHNDAWARMDGAQVSGFHDVRTFRKVYSSGNGNWQIAATVEVGQHNFTKFRQQLTQGTHKFELSGRSNGYAIDYIEFVRVGGGTSTTTVATTSTASSSSSTSTASNKYSDGDLLSLHWDSSMDPDDLQAMILTRELLDSYSPTVDYMAVNGTKRTRNSGILSGSTNHMRSMFPSGYEAWRNGLNNSVQAELYADTVDAFATAWALTLSTGSTVHVAEGGPANFTASVITELMSRGLEQSQLKRIRVIQHSWGWNEDNTDQKAMDIIRQYATYTRIADGNYGNGHGSEHSATPDYALLNGNSSQRANCSSFRSRSAKTEYAQQWEDAYALSNNRCDGSDAVEVVWILGINTNRIPTLSAFADNYF